MRVQLPTPPPPPEGAGPAVSAPALVVSSALRPEPPRSTLDRWVHRLSGWAAVLPAALLCSAVLTWSIGVRLGNQDRLMAVHARSLKPIEVLDPPVSAAQLAVVRQQSVHASAALFEQPSGIEPILSGLERRARELGWRVEITMKPLITRPGGFADLALHPVLVQLNDEGERPEPAYQRLLAWLRTVSSLPRRVDVVSLHLRPAGAALGAAQIELQFYSKEVHAETSAQ